MRGHVITATGNAKQDCVFHRLDSLGIPDVHPYNLDGNFEELSSSARASTTGQGAAQIALDHHLRGSRGSIDTTRDRISGDTLQIADHLIHRPTIDFLIGNGCLGSALPGEPGPTPPHPVRTAGNAQMSQFAFMENAPVAKTLYNTMPV